MSEYCSNCRYYRVDEDTGTPYCKQTYTNVNADSIACDSFVEDDDDY